MKDLEALNVHHRFGGQKRFQGGIDTVRHHNARPDCKMRIIMVPRMSTIYLPDVITQPNLPRLPPVYLHTASNQILEVGMAWG